MTRPKLLVEKLADKEIDRNAIPEFEYGGNSYAFPHCEPRVLHLPEECEYCAKATELQEERERLAVSNTGHTNRKWPCPAERARSLEGINKWHGNVARKEGDPDPYVDAIIEAVSEFNKRE